MTDTPISGHVAPGFEPVREAFEANFASGEEHGASFALRMGGETLVDLRGGWADRAKERVWDETTIVPIYSASKGISALVLAMAVETLPAGYETPVADVWPEFAAEGKGEVTIGQIVSHQAGLPGFEKEIDPALWLDPPACAAAIAALPPMWPPGSAHGYHPLTWGYMLGEVVERITGRSVGTILKEDICGPAGIDFQIGLPEADEPRVGDMLRPKALAPLGNLTPERKAAFVYKWSSPDRAGRAWREIEIPSANGHGAALAVASLYEAYARGGQVAGGKTLIRGDTLEALTRPRVDGPDLVLPMDTKFGAGIMINSHGKFGPNPETLGHSGWGGSMAIADPARELSAAYVMNRQSSSLVGDPRAAALVEAVYGCL
ncbi:MAG: esterase [Hyphomonas sp. 34-62-18]|nr:serine hydrolase domain-containing protein [Hyphomonas sp. 34-62-18]OZB18066.1 MAG: esterase [Hyphomonas sp. 34-62-18]